jgi:hypothetical protein
MKAGILPRAENSLLSYIEQLEAFVGHVDKVVNLNQSQGKELEQKTAELSLLEKELYIVKANLESTQNRSISFEQALSDKIKDLIENNERLAELESELHWTKTSHQDSLDQLQGQYDSAKKQNDKIDRVKTWEYTDLAFQKEVLEKEVSELKVELEEIQKKNSSNSHRLNLTQKELETIQAEYIMVKDKYLKFVGEHQAEVRTYQLEIEDLNFKLTQAKKATFTRHDSIDLSLEDNGLDSDFLGAVVEDLENGDRYSHNSDGSRNRKPSDTMFAKKELTKANRKSILITLQNTTIEKSTQNESPAGSKSAENSHQAIVAELRSVIESHQKSLVEKDLEIEELRLSVSAANVKLSSALNDFTEEVYMRDKLISTLKSQIRSMQSQANDRAKVKAPENNDASIMDDLLNKYFK